MILSLEFEMKDLGSLRYFLGMEVTWSKKEIIVSQKKFIIDLLKEINISGCRPSETLIEANRKLGDSEKKVSVDKTRYQKLVGKLIYLSHTHPCVAYAVTKVSQFIGSWGILKVLQGMAYFLRRVSNKELKFIKVQTGLDPSLTGDPSQAIALFSGEIWSHRGVKAKCDGEE